MAAPIRLTAGLPMMSTFRVTAGFRVTMSG